VSIVSMVLAMFCASVPIVLYDVSSVFYCVGIPQCPWF